MAPEVGRSQRAPARVMQLNESSSCAELIGVDRRGDHAELSSSGDELAPPIRVVGISWLRLHRHNGCM